jgi:hypothetical protein
MSQLPVPPPDPSPDGPSSDSERLLLAMDQLHGYSEWSCIADVCDLARQQFGFVGSLADAIDILKNAPNVEVESRDGDQDTRMRRVTAGA